MISCGKAPLFSNNITEQGVKQQQTLGSNEIIKWDGQINYALQWIEKPKLSEKSSLNLKFWDQSVTNFLGPYLLAKKPLCVCSASKNIANPRIVQIGFILNNLKISSMGTKIKTVSIIGANKIAPNPKP